MQAVRIHRYGGPEELVPEQVPDPVPGEGEILVRLLATSVNPIDYKMRSGAAKERFPVQFPAILGRDLSGIVESTGPGVTQFETGQKVLALAWHTYAELVTVKANDVTHLPDGVDPVAAAALPLVSLTGDQLVRRAARVHAGKTVLVTGALGSVGRAAIHSARKAGATVIAGVRKVQIEAALGLNANDVIALDDESALRKLMPLDAVADTIGGDVATKLIAKLKDGGMYGSVVGPPKNAQQFPGVTVNAMMAVPDPSKVREFADDLRDGKFRLPIRTELPLTEAAEAHRLAEHGGGSQGKILLF